MQYIAAHNSDVRIVFVDTAVDEDTWNRAKQGHGITSNAVPRTIIGEDTFIGFSKNNGPLEYSEPYQGYIGYYNQIIAAIETELGSSIELLPEKSSWYRWLPLIVLFLLLTGYTHPLVRKGSQKTKRYWLGGLIVMTITSLFVLASTIPEARLYAFSSNLPFPVFVFILAFFDGFNPCAFSIFIIFLSMLTHTIKRSTTAILGFVFIATSAIMYFIFILGIVAVGSVLFGAVGKYISIVVGIGMLLIAVINIKDYWLFKKGPSLTISDTSMAKTSRKAGRIISRLEKNSSNPGSIIIAITSTIALAAFVNLIELGCTAILPAVYMTNLLKHYGRSFAAPHFIYTLFYAGVYVIPLVLLLLGFKLFFKTKRLSELQGRTLKLISGVIMLIFGVVLIFRPEVIDFR